MNVCKRQVKLCDPSLTHAIPERFRNEHRTHYKALYKCTVYFSYFGGTSTNEVSAWISPVVVSALSSTRRSGTVGSVRGTPGTTTGL